MKAVRAKRTMMAGRRESVDGICAASEEWGAMAIPMNDQVKVSSETQTSGLCV
jgi:hypothetical protein